MVKKRHFIKTYLKEDEYKFLTQQARKAGVSNSKFVKLVCMGQEVKSIVDLDALILVKNSKADLGRLGGLLKYHLADNDFTEEWHQDLRSLLKSLEHSQKQLVKDCQGLTDALIKGIKK